MPAHNKTELQIELADGAPVLLRPILPEDRWRLQEGLHFLSNEARYMRFFSPMSSFSEEQLKYLTEVDQENHVAWIALDASSPKMPGIGIGRFIRLEQDKKVAEFALVVIDPFQGKGLAGALLAVLFVMAEKKGVETLRGVLLGENLKTIQWLLRLGATEMLGVGGCVEMDLRVEGGALPQNSTARIFWSRVEELGQRMGGNSQ